MKKNRAMALLLAALLALSGCGGSGESEGAPTTKAPTPKARLEVPLRYYDESTGTVLEMPQIVGDDSGEAALINAEMADWYEDLEAYYAAGTDGYWGELLAYPTENDRFLNAVVTFCELPTYGTCGEVYSWVYNKNTKLQVTLESALKSAGTDADRLLSDIAQWAAAEEGMEVLGFDTLAFRMLEDGVPQFIAGTAVAGPYEGEMWVSFFTWTDGLVDWPYAVPVDPAEVTGTFEDGPLRVQGGSAEVPGSGSGEAPEETYGEVWLSWTASSEGAWPFTQTLETLEFCGNLNAALEDANESLRVDAENAKGYFEECKVMGEAACYENGGSWADLWAYPVATDRYLSAVTVQRQNMHFRVADAARTWDMVSSVVYDKQARRIVSLEEAFAMAGLDQGALERQFIAFARTQNIGVYEDVSSLAFCMGPDAEPIFLLGAVVRENDVDIPWTMFFTWDGGEIAWPWDHPMALGLVSEHYEGLSCLAGMGQYDGAAMISPEEAASVLAEIVEVQDFLAMGMEMATFGDTVSLDGEEHLCIDLGTDGEDAFTTERIYAVSWYSVYSLDELTGAWIPVGFG